MICIPYPCCDCANLQENPYRVPSELEGDKAEDCIMGHYLSCNHCLDFEAKVENEIPDGEVRIIDHRTGKMAGVLKGVKDE